MSGLNLKRFNNSSILCKFLVRDLVVKCIIDRLEAEALKFWENHSTLRNLQVELSGKRTELLLSENWNFRPTVKFWIRYKINLL